MPLTVGVLKESFEGETRVALTPEISARLQKLTRLDRLVRLLRALRSLAARCLLGTAGRRNLASLRGPRISRSHRPTFLALCGVETFRPKSG